MAGLTVSVLSGRGGPRDTMGPRNPNFLSIQFFSGNVKKLKNPYFEISTLSNASGERSFSVLKRVKNYLRNTMGEERLNNLAILYIEQEILNRIDTAKIIEDFARNKARRKFL